jgi:hypothetical protein
MQLRSYVRLRLEDMTPLVYPDFGRTSRFQLYLLTPVAHHGSSCRMSYHLICEKLGMVGLNDCIILQPGHLVGSRLGGTHDSISVQNLSILRLRMHE